LRLLGREGGNAARHRHAEIAQHGLGLILVDIHAAASSRDVEFSAVPGGAPRTLRDYFANPGAIFLHASTSLSTPCPAFSNIERPAPARSTSTTPSTLLVPIPTGTPT